MAGSEVTEFIGRHIVPANPNAMEGS